MIYLFEFPFKKYNVFLVYCQNFPRDFLISRSLTNAAFMPLNKNICHLLLAFWLNAKLNEVDLHIS